jgi:photosynthetic reaction center cytochrome c subunit
MNRRSPCHARDRRRRCGPVAGRLRRTPADADRSSSGYRGTGMEQVYNPRIVARQQAAEHVVPERRCPPQAPTTAPRPGDVYQNVKVLGDLSGGRIHPHTWSR